MEEHLRQAGWVYKWAAVQCLVHGSSCTFTQPDWVQAEEGLFSLAGDVSDMPSWQFWHQYGQEAPTLRKLAMRVLSKVCLSPTTPFAVPLETCCVTYRCWLQVSSACACERNWSF